MQTADEDVIVRVFLPFWREGDSLMHVAVTQRGLLATMLGMLTYDVGPDRRRALIESYCSQAEDDAVCRQLVPLCSLYERNAVLIAAVDRGHHKTAVSILQRGLCEGHLYRWAIRTAALDGSSALLTDIASLGSETHLSAVLDDLTTEKNWAAVCRVLSAALTARNNSWAARMIRHMPWPQLRQMCLELSEEDVKDVVMSLVSNELWRPVGQLLKLPNTSRVRPTVIGLAIQQLEQQFLLTFILPACTDDAQRQVVMDVCVRRKMWTCVRNLVETAADDLLYSAAIEQTARQAEEEDVLLLMEKCSTSLCRAVLNTAIRRGLWKLLVYLCKYRGCALQGDLDDDQNRALETAVSVSHEDDLVTLADQLS